MIRVALDDADFRAVSSRMLAVFAAPEKLYKFWGKRVVESAKKSARGHSKGGRFWPSIADAVRIASSSPTGVVIVCDHFAAAQKQYGGEITAKKAKALTIPIHHLARGKRAGELAMEGIELIHPKGKNVLGMEQDGRFIGLYALVKSVNQSAEPWWPPDDDVINMGREEAVWLMR